MPNDSLAARKRNRILIACISSALLLAVLIFLGLILKENIHNQTLSGVIIAQDGTPLSGVIVAIQGSDTGVETDWKGEYSLIVESGSREQVTVIATKDGFKPYRERVTLQKGETEHNFVMKP